MPITYHNRAPDQLIAPRMAHRVIPMNDPTWTRWQPCLPGITWPKDVSARLMHNDGQVYKATISLRRVLENHSEARNFDDFLRHDSETFYLKGGPQISPQCSARS
jgi:hypothetical protein